MSFQCAFSRPTFAGTLIRFVTGEMHRQGPFRDHLAILYQSQRISNLWARDPIRRCLIAHRGPLTEVHLELSQTGLPRVTHILWFLNVVFPPVVCRRPLRTQHPYCARARTCPPPPPHRPPASGPPLLRAPGLPPAGGRSPFSRPPHIPPHANFSGAGVWARARNVDPMG